MGERPLDESLLRDRAEVRDLMASNWTFLSERDLLASFLKRIEGGRPLTDRQDAVVRKIRSRIAMRKEPKIYGGGAPGSRGGGRRG